MQGWRVAVCALVVSGGCVGVRGLPKADAPPSQAAAAEAAFEGRTARQWLDHMRGLENDSAEWSGAAVQASTAFGELRAQAVPVLLAGMKDSKWHIREYSCFEIGKLGDAAVAGGAVEALVEAMRDENFLVTEAGEAGIGNLGMTSAKARARMIALLASPDPFVRKKVAMELGALGYTGRESLPALEKLLQDPDPEVRDQAREAMESIKRLM